MSSPTIYSSDQSTSQIGALSGIAPHPSVNGPYALITYSDPNVYDTYGRLQYGKYVLSLTQFGKRMQVLSRQPGTFDMTVTVVLNDHIDQSKDTVLGVLHERLTILPDSVPV